MKKILFIVLVLFVASSCTKLEDMNVDTKGTTAVPSETLFTNAQKELSDQLASINVNTNVFKLFAQYITETTYTDEANYNIVNRNIPENAFRNLYKDVLMDLKESAKILKSEPIPPGLIGADLDNYNKNKANRHAVIDVLRIFTFNRLLDMFGDIPYSEALDIDNVNPKYDDAVTIYKQLFTDLDAAIQTLNDGAGTGSFGSADIIYNGDDAKWLMFANGLKLKMATHIADAPNGIDVNKAISEAAPNVFASNDDNALFRYFGATPNTNPLYLDLVASGRADFVATNTMVDLMLSMDDTIRLGLYYTKTDTSTDDAVVKLAFVGGDYGYSNKYSHYSHLNATLEDPTFPCVLMDYTEIQFYLAEAADKGLGGISGASTYYDAAVTSSFEYWGSDAATASTYLATNPYVDINSIGVQAWIGFFNRGFFGWTSWRRLDVPTLNDPPNNNNGAGIFPVRYTYPVNEQTLNGVNRAAAATAIGGDFQKTKLFWDIN